MGARDKRDTGGDAEIHLKAKARRVTVRRIEGAYTRGWGGEDAEVEHDARRSPPEPLAPGEHGPVEREVRVRVRLRDRDKDQDREP